MLMGDPRPGVGEGEQTAGKIGMGVALKFEHDRIGAALDPNLAMHHAPHAIVNLPAYHAVMNSEGHVRSIKGSPGSGKKRFEKAFCHWRCRKRAGFVLSMTLGWRLGRTRSQVIPPRVL